MSQYHQPMVICTGTYAYICIHTHTSPMNIHVALEVRPSTFVAVFCFFCVIVVPDKTAGIWGCFNPLGFKEDTLIVFSACTCTCTYMYIYITTATMLCRPNYELFFSCSWDLYTDWRNGIFGMWSAKHGNCTIQLWVSVRKLWNSDGVNTAGAGGRTSYMYVATSRFHTLYPRHSRMLTKTQRIQDIVCIHV